MDPILEKFASPDLWLYLSVHVGRTVLRAPLLWAIAVLAVHLAGLTLSLLLAIALRPRLLEDLSTLHGWMDRREPVVGTGAARAALSLLLLPLTLVAGAAVALLFLSARTALRLALQMQLLRCPNCRTRIPWTPDKLTCEHCGHAYIGTLDTPCPRCLFAPNAAQCPTCAYLFTHGLDGQGPSPLARQGDEGTEGEAPA